MIIKSALVGSVPRPLALSKYISRYHAGKISMDILETKYMEYTEKVITKLINLGLDVITDGMLRWDDIFNPLISFIEGVDINGLYRFYDNNFFYRAPVVKGKVKIVEDIPFPKWFKLASEILKKITSAEDILLKPVLPGPLTLTMHSINEFYSSRERLLEDYIFNVLHPILMKLKDSGATVIELHEPSCVALNVPLKLLYITLNYLSKLSSEIEVRIWLQFYFGSIRRVYKVLKGENFIVGIDLVDYPEDLKYLEKVKEPNYGISLGVLNSRNTLMEDPKYIRKVVKKVVKLRFNEIYLSPNTLLDFLPENVAYKKLKRLSRIAKYLREKL